MTENSPPTSRWLILYPVIATPPLFVPSAHVRPSVVAVLCYVSSARLIGMSGTLV
jgi:hypothetical protein